MAAPQEERTALLQEWVIEDGVDVAVPEADGALCLEVALERETARMEAREFSAVLSVRAPAAAGERRAPLRLVAVLDGSKSMAGEKIRLVRETMRFVLRHLGPQDRLGVVAYDSEVRVLAPLTPCDDAGRDRLEAAIASLRPGSATNLSGGLITGLDLHREAAPQQRFMLGNTCRKIPDTEVHEWAIEVRFESADDAALVRQVTYTLHKSFPQRVVEVCEPPFRVARRSSEAFVASVQLHLKDGRTFDLEHELTFAPPETFRTVSLPLRAAGDCGEPREAVVRSTFLFTDGLANVAFRGTKNLCKSARSKLEQLGDSRCAISTFGFGEEHSPELLEQLARLGGGTYSFIEDEDQLAQAFGEALGGLLSTTHQNARLTLTLAPGVELARACTDFPVQVCDDAGGQTVDIELGDLYAEERRDILVHLRIPMAGVLASQGGREVLGRLRGRAFNVRALRSDELAEVKLCLQRSPGLEPGGCHPCLERHRNRFVATEVLKESRRAAKRGHIDEALRLLSAAAEALGSSSLAAAGDQATLSLIADISECMADLRRQESNSATVFKKMTCLQQGHSMQRCANMAATEVYGNSVSRTTKALFKGVK